jgi:hypothetical protein
MEPGNSVLIIDDPASVVLHKQVAIADVDDSSALRIILPTEGYNFK